MLHTPPYDHDGVPLSASEHETEVRALIRKAELSPEKAGDARQAASAALIELTRSQHPTLKILAAEHLPDFFVEFEPDLQEAVTHAVLDLCEDADEQMRIRGYKAIVQLSRNAPAWTKRNTHMLVQLLQEDESDELTVVKQSLVEHVQNDACAALEVLCDYMVQTAESDASQIVGRGDLMGLVLTFLAEEAHAAILERVNAGDTAVESVLRDGLFNCFAYANAQESKTIIESLVLPLPSFQTRSDHGETLLQLVIDKAKIAYKDDISSVNTVTLQATRSHLELARQLTQRKASSQLSAARALPLLQFCCHHLIGKMLQTRLTADAQIYIIGIIAYTLNADDQPDSQPYQTSRNMIVDACPLLLNAIPQSQLRDRASLKAIVTLVNACYQRRMSSPWTVPTNLANALRGLQETASKEAKGMFKAEIEELLTAIRTLFGLQPSGSSPSLVARRQDGAAKRQSDGRLTPSSTSSARARPSQPAAPTADSDRVTNPRPSKRMKTTDSFDSSSPPPLRTTTSSTSLYDRMAPLAGSSQVPFGRQRRAQQSQPLPQSHSPEELTFVGAASKTQEPQHRHERTEPFGWSFKGAAASGGVGRSPPAPDGQALPRIEFPPRASVVQQLEQAQRDRGQVQLQDEEPLLSQLSLPPNTVDLRSSLNLLQRIGSNRAAPSSSDELLPDLDHSDSGGRSGGKRRRVRK